MNEPLPTARDSRTQASDLASEGDVNVSPLRLAWEAENVGAASRHVFLLGRDWKAAGLKTIHFELAGYVSQQAVEELLSHAGGAITSLGMSHSELLAMNLQ